MQIDVGERTPRPTDILYMHSDAQHRNEGKTHLLS